VTTVLLTTSLIAICLGIARLSPSLAIGMAILCGPAYIRTALVLERAESPRHSSTLRRVGTFVESFAIIVGMIVCGILALLSAVALFLSLGVGLAVGLGVIAAGILECLAAVVASLLGLVCGLGVMTAMLRKLWPDLEDIAIAH
jgi:hypothetical protein